MLEKRKLEIIANIIDVVYGDEAEDKRFEQALAITAKHLNLSSIWLNLWESDGSRLLSSFGLSPHLRELEQKPHKDCQCYEFVKNSNKDGKIFKVKDCQYVNDKSVFENVVCHFSLPLRAGKTVLGVLNFGLKKETSFDKDLTRLICKVFSAAIANRVYCQRIEEQKELLSRRKKDMEVFVSAVSHDMKTPIIAVKGFLNLIHKKYDNNLHKGLGRYINQVEKGVNRIEELAKDLLNLSRVEKVLNKLEEISVDEVLQASLKNIRPLIRHRKPKIKVIGEKPVITGNWMAFFQIFTNLIANAIKYTPDDRRPEVKVIIKREEKGWLFVVSDNGIGLTEKEKSKIFEPFTKVKTLSREGSGVGLSIVKKLVEGLGGNISVESEKGKGTSFYVFMPFVEMKNAEGETRTRTGLTPLDPEPSVSASSTTSAS